MHCITLIATGNVMGTTTRRGGGGGGEENRDKNLGLR